MIYLTADKIEDLSFLPWLGKRIYFLSVVLTVDNTLVMFTG
ncbi:hypothetical protein Aazo_1457 ['Nostoc azollae' 0708]|uniref:Uncharacterized protein n=1 Tax=Nostoc azollae (strain 0708) TaxID=551115 RepID=D7E410_NOSA0|nr:hypothetical protein Aazo_1457 ['Nostoc azollae' 0708]